MNLTDALLPSDWLLVANVVGLLVLLYAVRVAPWRFLLNHRWLQQVFLGASTAVFLIWTFEVGVHPGLGFHFLGATIYTLMFGWSLAVIGLSLVLVMITVFSGDWAALALNALVLVVVPVSISYGVYRLVYRYLPHHLFIYIFLCGFFNAMLAAGVAVWVMVMLLVSAEVYTFARISAEHLPYLPLYLFPEGFLNGMLTTVLIALKPDWLKTYDDAIYLKG